MNWLTILWWAVGIMFPLLTFTTVYVIIFWWKLKKAYNKDFDIFIDKSNSMSLLNPATHQEQRRHTGKAHISEFLNALYQTRKERYCICIL